MFQATRTQLFAVIVSVLFLGISVAVAQDSATYLYTEGSLSFHYQQFPFGPYSGDFAAAGSGLGEDGTFAPGQTEAAGGGLDVAAADTSSALAYGAVQNPDGSVDLAGVVVRGLGELAPGTYPVDTVNFLVQFIFFDDVQEFVLPDIQDPDSLLAWFSDLEMAHTFVGVTGSITVEEVTPEIFRGTFSGTMLDIDGFLIVSISGGQFEATGPGIPLAAPATPELAAATLSVYPNPFNPQTAIRCELPRSETVRVAVYDPAGRRVRTLHAGRLEAGEHVWTWDGCDDGGRRQPAGVYLLRAQGASVGSSVKVVLLP